jgi:hypothetical protein
MRKLLIPLCLLGLLAITVVAADITGEWVAQVPGRQGNTMETTFKLKASGDALTGSVVTQRGEAPISDGKISGDEISFNQKVEFNGNEMTFKYKGKVSGDEIKFTREREGGQGKGGPQEFTAKRKST